MPIQDGVGRSEWTPIKLQHLESIMAMHIAITQAVLHKWPHYSPMYHYIDATAGPGRYAIGNQSVSGSPLVFLAEAENREISYRADFC
jgi:hypothetical protein